MFKLTNFFKEEQKKSLKKEVKKMKKFLRITALISLVVAVVLFSGIDLYARGTSSGTILSNKTIQIFYSNVSGTTYSNTSALGTPETTTVLPGFDLPILSTPQLRFTNSAGAFQPWDFSWITNMGNISDDITITVETNTYSGPGWIPLQFTIATNFVIVTQGNNLLVYTQQNVLSGNFFRLSVGIDIPAGVADGTTNMFRVSIQNSAAAGDGWPTIMASALGVPTDTTDLRDYQEFYLTIVIQGPIIQISKIVDITNARPFSILTYTIHYTNAGGAPAFGVRIEDEIPVNTVLITNSAEDFNTVAASVEYDNGAWTNDDYGTIAENTNITKVRWTLLSADTEAGDAGDLVFKVLIK